MAVPLLETCAHRWLGQGAGADLSLGDEFHCCLTCEWTGPEVVDGFANISTTGSQGQSFRKCTIARATWP